MEAPEKRALCILNNVAGGSISKNCIMSNEDVLRKILHYLVQHNVVLQIAAVMCIYNLVRKDEEDSFDIIKHLLCDPKGAVDRLKRLKEMGLHTTLQQLHNTTNSDLCERVKLTFQQFS